jgi:hypothetical protein
LKGLFNPQGQASSRPLSPSGLSTPSTV